jgi:hypothetical protein
MTAMTMLRFIVAVLLVIFSGERNVLWMGVRFVEVSQKVLTKDVAETFDWMWKWLDRVVLVKKS